MERRLFLGGILTVAIRPLRGDDVIKDSRRLVIDDFSDPGTSRLGIRWAGFSDRVMGGVSTGNLAGATIEDRRCLRLTGRVTRERNGGFLQMALDLAHPPGFFDASGYGGLELLVWGNNERYNIHLRTADVRWYDQSYRTSFQATPTWERLRIPWSAFEPHGLDKPLDLARLRRVGLLGWMREFQVDLALAELALYR